LNLIYGKRARVETRTSSTSRRFAAPHGGIVAFRSHDREGSSRLLPCLGFGQDAHVIALFHDQVVDAIDPNPDAQPLAEQDMVYDLKVNPEQFSRFNRARQVRRLRLRPAAAFPGGVGNDNAAGRLCVRLDGFDEDAI
jgi:hypothetical protein